MPNVALVLLAAGASSRMGSAKQLMAVDGEPMLRRAARAALASRCRPVVVVVGANADAVRSTLQGLGVAITMNPAWERGMGTSIRAGVAEALASGADAVLIALGDQPLVDASAFDRLVERMEAGDVVAVASSYGDTIGAPALFSGLLSDRLLAVGDEKGCKHLLLEVDRERPGQLAVVACPEAASDVDTPEDLGRVAEALDRRSTTTR